MEWPKGASWDCLFGLKAWTHRARAYATEVHAVTGRFPRHEGYGLRSQMNRAVNSVSLNIAEGAARSTDRAFDYHWEIAVGSTFIGRSYQPSAICYRLQASRKDPYRDED